MRTAVLLMSLEVMLWTAVGAECVMEVWSEKSTG